MVHLWVCVGLLLLWSRLCEVGIYVFQRSGLLESRSFRMNFEDTKRHQFQIFTLGQERRERERLDLYKIHSDINTYKLSELFEEKTDSLSAQHTHPKVSYKGSLSIQLTKK